MAEDDAPKLARAATPGGGRRADRAAAIETAILAVARELLAEGGVQRLTVEGVAARSGVAKTTVYRRWRSKEDLALAVIGTTATASSRCGRPRSGTWSTAGSNAGSCGPDVDIDTLRELLFGPIYHRLLLSGGHLDDAFAERIVDAVLPSIATDGYATPNRTPQRRRGRQPAEAS